MTAINLNNQISNSPLTNQNSIASTSIKNSNGSKLYLGPGWTNVPGITNLFYAPYEFVQSIKAMFKADRINDREGILVNGLRVASTPFSLINSLSEFVWYVFKGGFYFHVISHSLSDFLVPLSTFASGIGFIMCALELALEAYGIVKAKQFYFENYPFELESFKKILDLSDPILKQQKISESLNKFLKFYELPIEVTNEIKTFLNQGYSTEEFNHLSTDLFDRIEKNIYTANLKKIQQTYLQISPEIVSEVETYVKHKFQNLSLAQQREIKEKMINETLQRKKNGLIRRVHPWLADEIQKAVPEILQDLQSSNPLKSKEAKEKAAEIFKCIKTQSMKKFLIHGIGLAAVLITFAGLILSCVACPLFIPLVVLTIGGILALVRYYLDAGFMDSRGWEFKIENCIPSFIKKLTTPKQKVPEPLIPLTLDLTLASKQDSFSLESSPSIRNRLNYTITVPPGIVA